MASQQIGEIIKKLDMVTEKQDNYEQLFLKNEHDTGGTSFTGKITRKAGGTLTLISSIKDEIG